MIRIPVMFVVEIGSVITTIEFIDRPSLFVGLVTRWLWATVLFANFAEAVAEGRGKAQAATSSARPAMENGVPPQPACQAVRMIS
jgi:K+-transporting ATPase ATPase B chain